MSTSIPLHTDTVLIGVKLAASFPFEVGIYFTLTGTIEQGTGIRQSPGGKGRGGTRHPQPSSSPIMPTIVTAPNLLNFE